MIVAMAESVASADSLIDTHRVTGEWRLGSSSSAQEVRIPQFDAGGGIRTLQAARFELSVAAWADLAVQNRHSAPILSAYGLTSYSGFYAILGLSMNDSVFFGSVAFMGGLLDELPIPTLAPDDGVDGPLGLDYATLGSATGSSNCLLVLDQWAGDEFDGLIGDGSTPVWLQTYLYDTTWTSTSFPGGGAVYETLTLDGRLSWSLTVTYQYSGEPLPTPAGTILLGGAGVAGIRRRR